MRDGFDLLNASERRFLRLLSQGHTAKSIAIAERCSLNAVNERLREARRKTGIGSSRELARLVAAQENCDEQIGMAPPPATTASNAQQAFPPARPIWRKVMLTLPPIAAIALAATIAQPDPPRQTALEAKPKEDPFETAQDRLVRLLDRQPRDAHWADRIESALDRRFAAVDRLSERKVRCRTSLCEVSARLTSGPGTSVNDAMQNLQGPALAADLRALGLRHVVSSFEREKDRPTQTRYVSFWTR